MNRFGSIQSSWLMLIATIITVAIVCSSQLVTDRIRLQMDRQASELLAADLVIASSQPLSDRYREKAREYQLTVSDTVSLRTAIFSDGKLQLVELKAVDDLYPLRGKMQISDSVVATKKTVTNGPAPAEVWVDTKLLNLVGQSINLGTQHFPVSALINYEPDRAGALFNLAPRIMMNLKNLSATGLIVRGSRAQYRLLLAGNPANLKDFGLWIKSELSDIESIEDLQNARPEMRNALDRTRLFFSLSITLTLVIAMVAIAITARYSASRESSTVAVMRAFGISRNRLYRHYFFAIGRIWMMATIAGLILGWGIQTPLEWALGGWFGTELPTALSFSAFFNASIVGLISLAGFSLPNLVDVIATPPMQVLRPTYQKNSSKRRVILLISALAAVFLVLLILMRNSSLALIILAIVFFTGLVLPWIFKHLINFLLITNRRKFWIRQYLLSRLSTESRAASFVMSGFSLALIAILLISVVKDELLSDWQSQLPADVPNYFLVNISTSDVEPIVSFLNERQIESSPAYPLVRTRLTHINDVDVNQIDFDHPRAYGIIQHTFNVSYSDEIPDDNEIVAGEWKMQDSDKPAFSVEQGMAEKLGLKMGDKITLSIGADRIEAPVANIRSVVWENFKPNFFLLGTAKMIEDLPRTWLLSALIEDSNQSALKPLLTRFPSVTLLDISILMDRIRGIVNRATLALEFFFVFALASSLVVLLAAIQTGREDRRSETALLRALSAKTSQLYRVHVFEFALMGFLIGLFSAAVATLVGWGISTRVFDMDYQFSWQIWIISLVAATTVLTAAGVLVSRKVYRVSPMQILRS
ncbi:MAG: putative ABC transport system permease protein [Gammaproteobacteria bacterium]|jgi:putative ABC transport system permease protein